jgi:hypothetical protein
MTIKPNLTIYHSKRTHFAVSFKDHHPKLFDSILPTETTV